MFSFFEANKVRLAVLINVDMTLMSIHSTITRTCSRDHMLRYRDANTDLLPHETKKRDRPNKASKLFLILFKGRTMLLDASSVEYFLRAVWSFSDFQFDGFDRAERSVFKAILRRHTQQTS